MTTRCVVAGGAGAVGTLFVELLTAAGADVHVADSAAGADITAPDALLAAELAMADVVVLAVPEPVALQALGAVTAALSPGALLVDIELFDVFRSPAVGEGRRSLAYRLRLQSPERNLNESDIAEVRRGAVASAAKLGAELRG